MKFHKKYITRKTLAKIQLFRIIMGVKFPFSKTYLSLLFLCLENIISMISLHHILLKNKWYPPNEPSTTAVSIC